MASDTSSSSPLLGIVIVGGLAYLAYYLLADEGEQQMLPHAVATPGGTMQRVRVEAKKPSKPETQFLVFDDETGIDHPVGSYAAAKTLARKLHKSHPHPSKIVVGRKSDLVSVWVMYSDGSAGTINKGRWYSAAQP